MSTNKTQAVQDLIWLSERLSGVIAIKDELTNHDALSNQLSELSEAIEIYKKELQAILEQKASAEKDVNDLLNKNAAIAADYKSRGDKLIEDSRLAADDLLQSLKSDISEKQTKAELKYKEILDAVELLKTQSKEIQEEIAQLTEKRNSIRQELDAVKNRI